MGKEIEGNWSLPVFFLYVPISLLCFLSPHCYCIPLSAPIIPLAVHLICLICFISVSFFHCLCLFLCLAVILCPFLFVSLDVCLSLFVFISSLFVSSLPSLYLTPSITFSENRVCRKHHRSLPGTAVTSHKHYPLKTCVSRPSPTLNFSAADSLEAYFQP